ncbi:iron-sulfur cluster assembly accessory protein [Sporothrix brasiliensis 5110]|uniref:Iron-sulfur assembly protein 1 n=1 Tax=Sporothrix brasiliensis 5110 TaxID=1398154 RepID=A0A0C2ISX6_9PEZI|nr:iron-sulfur cluster assembly accessory protein [Sporothrix brasiliensis 5110]KIH89960.1 iron-sulfur cluster assembly accessory protein [Sporothrix brasiliensis 5110]
MNALLPRQSAESACLFCRQGLVRQLRQHHPRRQLQPQQLQPQQHLFSLGRSSMVSPGPAHQRRRYLSSTAAAQRPPPFAQAEATSNSSTTSSATNPKTASSTTPYTRYSLYTEPTSPMTMRPPPPPSPVVPVDSPAPTAKEALNMPVDEAQSAATEAKQAEPKETSTTSTTSAAASAAAASPSTTPTTGAPKKRPSRLRTPRKAAMRLTPAAVDQVRELLEGPDPKLLKIGVRNRGCSGLSYNLEYVEKPGAFDEMVEQDGVHVLVDSKALFSIIGTEMDWVEDKLNQRFVFRNPNIKEECGCGESFMV